MAEGEVTEQPGHEIPCVLVCRECGDDLVIPFSSYRERGRWAAEHTRGTGHARWFCADRSACPTPEAAAAALVEFDRGEEMMREVLGAVGQRSTR